MAKRRKDSSKRDIKPGCDRQESAPSNVVSNNLFGELLVVVVLYGGIFLLSNHYQRPISLSNGFGWDGLNYGIMALDFAHGKRPEVIAPYVQRIGIPWSVAILFSKDEIYHGFRTVNLVGSLLSAILLLVWLRYFLTESWVRLLFVALYMATWHAPVRYVHHYVAYTDPWMIVILLAGLIVGQQARENIQPVHLILMTTISVVGVFIRDVAMMVPVTIFIASCLPDSWQPANSRQGAWPIRMWQPAIPVAAGALAYLAISYWVTQVEEYSLLESMLHWIGEKPFYTWVHGWFIAFGPILVLPLWYWRSSLKFLRENVPLAIYLFGFGVLGWVGGSDTERIQYWTMPVVYVLIGRLVQQPTVLQALPRFVWGLLVVAQLISARIFWTIPDFPNEAPSPWPLLTIMQNEFQYFDMYSHRGNWQLQTASLLQYLALCGLIMWLLRYHENKQRSDIHEKS